MNMQLHSVEESVKWVYLAWYRGFSGNLGQGDSKWESCDLHFVRWSGMSGSNELRDSIPADRVSVFISHKKWQHN